MCGSEEEVSRDRECLTFWERRGKEIDVSSFCSLKASSLSKYGFPGRRVFACDMSESLILL